MMLSADWATIASFATALGTLVLALATFVAVRSANRSARIAEASYQVNLRPVLVPSRLEDPPQKIRWMDNHWARLEGGQATVEFVDGSIYLAVSLRNVGPGLAVPFGWTIMEGASTLDFHHASPEDFRLQTRDLYVGPSDIGFWQAAIREHDDPDSRGSAGHRERRGVHPRNSLRRSRRWATHDHALRDDPLADGGGGPLAAVRGAALVLGPAGSTLRGGFRVGAHAGASGSRDRNQRLGPRRSRCPAARVTPTRGCSTK